MRLRLCLHCRLLCSLQLLLLLLLLLMQLHHLRLQLCDDVGVGGTPAGAETEWRGDDCGDECGCMCCCSDMAAVVRTVTESVDGDLKVDPKPL